MAERRRTNRTPRSIPAYSLLVLLVAGIGNVSALAPSRDESLARQLPLRLGGRVTIANSRGNVSISSWTRDLVDVRIRKHADTDQDSAQVPIDIRARDDEIAFTSTTPVYAPNLSVTVDYQLRVPAEVDLRSIKTVRGSIAISDVTGRAVLDVQTGTITVKAFAGTLDATTVNGQIDATVTRVDPSDSVQLETFNGDILLNIPKALKAHFAARTLNGAIQAAPRFVIRNNFGPQSTHVPAGIDDPMIRLTSMNGSIHIVER